MYYNKLNDIPPLPDDLKRDLIDIAFKLIESQEEDIPYKNPHETKDETKLNYLSPAEDLDHYNTTGEVKSRPLPMEFQIRLNEFYKEVNHPITNLFQFFGILYVVGGKFLAPHQDAPGRRKNGFQLLLNSGGEKAKTVWYDVKDEFKDLPITENCCIPYSRLTPVEEHSLDEGSWYFMNFNTIHSVENLDSIRFFLAGATEDIIDYTEFFDKVYK
jgi:hypothetical protein